MKDKINVIDIAKFKSKREKEALIHFIYEAVVSENENIKYEIVPFERTNALYLSNGEKWLVLFKASLYDIAKRSGINHFINLSDEIIFDRNKLGFFNDDENVIDVRSKKYLNDLILNNLGLYWQFLSSLPESRLILEKDYFTIKYKEWDVDSPLSENSKRGIDEDILEENKKIFKRAISNNKVAFIMGNGVSVPFGSDSWQTLTNGLIEQLKSSFIDNTDRINKLFGEIHYSTSDFSEFTLKNNKMENTFNGAIYYSIYRRFNPILLNNMTLLRAVCNIKNHSNYLPVLTYNYDNFAELQYFNYCFGKLQSLGPKAFLSSRTYSNNSIVHLHGIFSYKSKKPKNLILTRKQYFDHYSDDSDPVVKAQMKALDEYNCLFLGSSMTDIFQLSLIEKKHSEKDSLGKWRCFALLNIADLTSKEFLFYNDYLVKKGIHIIGVRSFDEMPKTLLNLFGCREL